ncbi:MAG TPA: Gfo/Idh/MocA family oxidoreductase [Verrucomicrobiae bacterium]|jgi:glucose-fructose oxidoreductase|nr:Gfo/Idh/MocA family oxidoreductase [Verrucomicrobiae bacterium]
MAKPRKKKSRKIRYAVVGLGYISQNAVLPAFEHARKNSELVALVSDDAAKLKKLSRQYRSKYVLTYDLYDSYMASGEIDAVYIALPNSMHREYTVRAAKAGIHILCEKPMAVTSADCEAMIRAAEQNRVKLMIAYRLHFDKANMAAVQIAESGKLGDLRMFNSVFSMQVKSGDIRLQKKLGGGTLYDIGIYCINAARYFFRSEPVEVTAFSANNGEKRFEQVDEMTSAILRFPKQKLAAFVTSFGAADTSDYRLVGSKGQLIMEGGYEYAQPRRQRVIAGSKTSEKKFPMKDQFGPELLYFSDCVLRDRQPEPSGYEGLADVRIIEALYRSAESGLPVRLEILPPPARPSKKQAMELPPVKKPELVHAASPHKEAA